MDNEGTSLPPSYYLLNTGITLVGIATVLLNLAIIVIVYRKLKDDDAVLTFLFNLAISDLVAGICVIYIAAYNFFVFQNIYECAIRSGMLCGIMMSSTILVLGLSLERYLKIRFPFTYARVVTKLYTRTFVLLSWSMAFGFAIAPVVKWVHTSHSDSVCGFFYVIKEDYIIVFTTIMNVLYACQCVMYGHIFGIAISKIKEDRVRPVAGDAPNTSSWRAWWKPTRVILVIIGTNFVTMTPVGMYI